MPSRVNVYCLKSVEHISAADILKGLNDLDWHLAAEYEGVEDDSEMDQALEYYSIEPGEDSWLVLNYRPPGLRQFSIDVWAETDQPEWIEETLEELNGVGTEGHAIVSDHLKRCIEIVSIETGFMQFVGVAPAFAHQVARYFAEVGDGLIEAEDQSWWKSDGGWFFESVHPNEQPQN
jgi:hypothetical protein